MQYRTRTLFLVWIFVCSPAFAQLSRTFVASGGSDTNPCTRLQPCRNFATAIAATASGGEVIVLDSAGYGQLNITTPVSIIAPPGVYAGIAAANRIAVTINAPGAIVALHGLSINGQGATTGVQVASVGTLYLERCSISHFTGYGFNFVASGHLFVADSVFRDNLFGFVAGMGGAVATGSVVRSRAENNTNDGFTVSGFFPPSSMSQIVFRDSIATNNGGNGFGSYASEATLRDCVAAKTGMGIETGSDSIMNVSNSMAVDNNTGFMNFGTGAVFNSFGNNQLVGNTTATSGTITTLGTQ